MTLNRDLFKPAVAVAFDMDGLMFETETVYFKAASELLRRRGFEYTQEVCDQIMGRPPEFCFKLFVKLFNLKEDWRDLQREDEKYFLRFLKDGYQTMPGLIELLDELDRRGIPYGVCTSSKPIVANEVLKKHGVVDRLKFIVTSDDVKNGKPDPEVYLKAAEKFNVEPAEMLVLEDSSAGCSAANAAGAPCCMLRAKHNRNANFSGAVAVVERLDDPQTLALLRK